MDECFIHFNGKSGELCQLTAHTIDKISEYSEKWIHLDGEPNKIASNVSKRVKRWSLGPDRETVREEIANVRFHKECYIRFCDKTKVARAERRIKKKTNTIDAFTQGETSTPVTHRTLCAPVRISPRTLLSGDENIVRRNKHVLPEQCIICKRQESYKVDKVQFNIILALFLDILVTITLHVLQATRKRKLHKLVLAQTFDGGKLREAAEKKKDESILAHIRGKDCVSIEVRYHKHCHLDYCRFLSRKVTGKQNDKLYYLSYNTLCSKTIEEKLIKKKKIMRTRLLHEIFVQQVMKIEELDASNYRPSRLKTRLQRDYSQLVFHRLQPEIKTSLYL